MFQNSFEVSKPATGTILHNLFETIIILKSHFVILSSLTPTPATGMGTKASTPATGMMLSKVILIENFQHLLQAWAQKLQHLLQA